MNYLYEALKRPTRLYIKKCSHCGLKYFGKTVNQDIEKYPGSGTRWNNHLNKHNTTSIHLWNSDWYYDTAISRFALKFSRLNKIVKSSVWANLREEDGLEGGWDYINQNNLSGNARLSFLLKTDNEFAKRFSENISLGAKKYQSVNGNPFCGKTHKEETKITIGINSSKHQTGSGNSQYGTMWITNGQENKKIKRDIDVIPEGWSKGRV